MIQSLLFSLLVTLIPASAQTIIYPPTDRPDIQGTNHHYVVTFDGEGEASVVANLTTTNLTTTPLTSLSYTVPGDSVGSIKAIYEYYEKKNETYCKEYNPKGECLITDTREVREVKYKLLEPEQSGTKLTFALSPAIESKESAALYLGYKTTGYVTEKALGYFTYTFPTLTTPQVVDEVRVAIYTDPNLYLKGTGTGKVNYTPTLLEGLTSYTGTGDTALKGPFASSDFSRALNNDTTVTKRATNLDPNEPFTVSGAYATSWWRLNSLSILWTILGVAAFVAIIVAGERATARKTHK